MTESTAVRILVVEDDPTIAAERNVARFESSGQLDWLYLSSLTADAVPALDRLPEPFRSCALAEIDLGHDGLASLNLGTARARALLAEHPIDTGVSCVSLRSE